MKTRNFLLGVSLLACALSGTLAWRAHVTARAASAERERLVAERAKAEARRHARERASAELADSLAKAEAALAAAKAQKARTSPATKPTEPPKGNASFDPSELMAKDPKLQAMSIAAKRARFETVYGPLLRALRLTPVQVARLGEARAKFDELQQDMTMVMSDKGLGPRDPAVVRLRQQAADELRAAQLEILGVEGVSKLEAYEGTLPARAITERFAGAMAVADRPMTAEQAERLTQIMAEAGSLAPGTTRLDPASIQWATVDRRAAEVLSPEQFSLFKRIEPIGGGASRWIAQFNRALQDAQAKMTGMPPGAAPRAR